MRHSDSSPSIPPHFVAFARRYHPSTCSSLRRTPGATSTASGVVSRCPRPRRFLRWRRRGLPGSRGNPPARMPRAPTPARSPPPRPLRRGEMTFRPTHDVGPRTQNAFRGSITRPTGSLRPLAATVRRRPADGCGAPAPASSIQRAGVASGRLRSGRRHARPSAIPELSRCRVQTRPDCRAGASAVAGPTLRPAAVRSEGRGPSPVFERCGDNRIT